MEEVSYGHKSQNCPLPPTMMIVADQTATELILGRDFLRAHQCIIEMGKSNDVLHFMEQVKLCKKRV